MLCIVKKKNGTIYIFTKEMPYDPFRFNYGFGVSGITTVFEVENLFGKSIDKKIILNIY